MHVYKLPYELFFTISPYIQANSFAATKLLLCRIFLLCCSVGLTKVIRDGL